MRPKLAAIASPVAALAVLAGCGSVSWDGGKVENTIHDVLTKQAHVQVKSVSCPSKAKIAKGVVTYCEATLTDGETVKFAATQTDQNGHVHIAPAEMIAPEVQASIQAALKKRGVSVTATCPQHVPVVVGRKFVCRARDAQGHSVLVSVTIHDRDAGFQMRLLG